MTAVVKAMANPESGLEVRDRMWLKITIPNAFIGENRVSVCILQHNGNTLTAPFIFKHSSKPLRSLHTANVR